MNWVMLIVAGIFEMMGVNSLAAYQQKRNIINISLLVVTFSLSFLFLYFAMKTIALGIAYATWTGIGSVGGVF